MDVASSAKHTLGKVPAPERGANHLGNDPVERPDQVNVRRVALTIVAMFGLGLAGCDKPFNSDAATAMETSGRGVSQPSPFVIPLLTGTDRVRANRLADAGCLLVRIPEGYELPLAARWADDGRLVLEEEGDGPRTIGVRVGWLYADGEKIANNPLDGLSADEIRGLWGIGLEHWSDTIRRQLEHIDPQRVCIAMTHEATQTDQVIPRLPAGIRYLRIRVNSSRSGFKDCSALRSLRELRFFDLSGVGKTVFDASLLEEARELKDLRLAGERIENLAAVTAFSHLECLDLRSCRDLSDASFADKMSKLTAINVSRTKITDLTSLGELARLWYVDASMSPVSKLPDGLLTAMRTLRVQSTDLSSEQVRKFLETNPACAVIHGWSQSLQDALAGTTRLRVRSGGTCHRDIENERTLYETTEASGIQELVAGLAIDEYGTRSDVHCMCCGEPSFEFFREDELILTLGLHHGESLRWVGGWPSDGILTSKSAAFVVEWLAEHGVDGPKRTNERIEEERRADERKMARVIEGLPPALQTAFREARYKDTWNTRKAKPSSLPQPSHRRCLMWPSLCLAQPTD